MDVPAVPASGAIALLANPTAGKGRYKDLIPAMVERLAASGRDVLLLNADTRGAAQQACLRAVTDGAAALVAAGGDGTLHLALQAVAGTGVPFGAIPAGTGNDFVIELGLPDKPLEAASLIADAVAQGRAKQVDLARVTGHGQQLWFGAVLGAGFDAIVNERANAMRFPRGPRRYDVAIFAELVRLRPRDYTLTLDGQSQQIKAVLIAVGNTASYGGGMRICPAANPYDGLLDVVLAGPISRSTLVRIKPQVREGTHVTHPAVSTYRAAVVEIAVSGPPIVAYADGERAFPLPMRIECVPGALTLLT